MKRHLSDNADLAVLRAQLIAKIASLLERTEEEIAAAAAVVLPTSDESDELLRIRHSVSLLFFRVF
jgi:hypothetical protein